MNKQDVANDDNSSASVEVESIADNLIDKAFDQAQKGLPTLVGLASHDFRDLSTEINEVRIMLSDICKKYPDIKFRFCKAKEGFQNALSLNLDENLPLKLSIKLNRNPKNDFPNLEIRTLTGKVFGPQPFLAIETKNKQFYNDNLDFDVIDGNWFYAFHGDTIPITDVNRIGIAANDKYGRTFIEVIKI